jgi:hypothetical protein
MASMYILGTSKGGADWRVPAGEPASRKGEGQATLYGHTLRDSLADSLLKCTATTTCRLLTWGIYARPNTNVSRPIVSPAW